jgi:hypothetical protein
MFWPEQAAQIGQNLVVADQQASYLIDRDQVAIKQPIRGAG